MDDKQRKYLRTIPCLTGRIYFALSAMGAKWVFGVSKLLIAITTALSARLTSALPCMSPAPYASLIRKGIVDSAYFFMVGFSSPFVFQVVPAIFLFVGLPPRPNDLRERADCRRRPQHPGFPGSARRSDRSVQMGMTDRQKYLPGKAAM